LFTFVFVCVFVGGRGDEDDVDGDLSNEDSGGGDERNDNSGGGDQSAKNPIFTWVDDFTGENNQFSCTGREEIHLSRLSKPISEPTIPEIYGLFVTDIIDYMVNCTNENAQNYTGWKILEVTCARYV